MVEVCSFRHYAVVERSDPPGASRDAVQQPLYPRHGVVEAHGGVEHQHPAEIEDLILIVQLSDESGLGPAEAVSGKTKIGDLDASLGLAPDLLHDPIEISGV